MGGATDEAREPTTGRLMEATAADAPEESAASPSSSWMEWSWKQGSDRRTDAAREFLTGGHNDTSHRSWNTLSSRKRLVAPGKTRFHMNVLFTPPQWILGISQLGSDR